VCSSKHILIVDDSSVVRRSLRSVLAGAPGCDICGEAVDGCDAIEKARQLRPDLVILDLSMPRMNGLEAARELRHLLPHVPLVMFTNFETAHLRKEAMDAGVNTVVLKTGPVQLLIDSIQSLLKRAC
jgi:DNA-binding NarL/FixJ family response regulator